MVKKILSILFQFTYASRAINLCELKSMLVITLTILATIQYKTKRKFKIIVMITNYNDTSDNNRSNNQFDYPSRSLNKVCQ